MKNAAQSKRTLAQKHGSATKQWKENAENSVYNLCIAWVSLNQCFSTSWPQEYFSGPLNFSHFKQE
jgi:hypothetical protein